MNSKLRYIPSLDGLRAIAVLWVIGRHWHLPNLNLEFGWIGVNLFFVLSGFLITNILIREKDKKLSEYLKIFYLKRTLRIFPVYYLYITVCIVFFYWYTSSNNTFFSFVTLDNAAVVLQKNIVGLLTYTFNFHDLIAYLNGIQETGSKFFGHLWSLSVEEQFYIAFPFVVYFLKRKHLSLLLIIIILGSPIVRAMSGYILTNIGNDDFKVGLILYKVTFFQLDSLAIGAYLAVKGTENLTLSNLKLYLSLFLVLVINLFMVYMLRGFNETVSYASLGFDLLANQVEYNTGVWWLDYKYAYTFTLLNLICAILLVISLRENLVSRALRNQWLVFIGKISYGIYLLHNPIFELYSSTLKKIGLLLDNPSLIYELVLFGFYLIIVIGISYLSFKYFESPFLRIKERLKARLNPA